ncbi:homoserine dehydrogenase-domain-containing protein [Gorgonomyces haynaldii]|nr:homoserine dehydrogenase-domain-containing protein [Gorgonomyces haynaldii]
MSLALIGPGLVGKAFLQQVKGKIPVVGVCSSKRMTLQPDLEHLELNQDLDMSQFLKHLEQFKPLILVDSTSSQEIADLYPEFIRRGFHIVTPNKKAFSGDLALYRSITSLAKEKRVSVRHESTVGAGLPILSTLNDLIATGDEIVSIQGIFSGTLSYIFNQFSKQGASVKFSDIVFQAKNLGYTEPDPREDLNGMDVGRKVVILSRLSGYQVDLSIPIENLVPQELQQAKDASEFLAKLPSFDKHFEQLNQAAIQSGHVLRYIGNVSPQGCFCKLERFPFDHPFASMKGSDNIINFVTKRFPNGIIVQGAGAGDQVTAFGMYCDVLRILGQ